MVYKNANRRILLLAKAGVIEEVKYTERTPHGRIDYKLTMDGLKQLMPYILTHPEEVENVVQYMDKFGINKKDFGELLVNKLGSIASAINEFYKQHDTREVLLTDIDRRIHEQVKQLMREHGLKP